MFKISREFSTLDLNENFICNSTLRKTSEPFLKRIPGSEKEEILYITSSYGGGGVKDKTNCHLISR